MKKLLFFALGMMLTLFACNPGHDGKGGEDTTAVVKTFNKVVLQDYEFVKAIDSTALFYEVQVEFDKTIDDSVAANIVSMETVAQLGNYCYMINRENPDGDSVVTVVEDLWLEDFDFNPAEMQITLPQAIDMVKAECVKDSLEVPATRFITLRRPVSKEFYEHPFYIFGRMLATVDAVTGEVKVNKMF